MTPAARIDGVRGFCALQALRERLRSKEAWVRGANSYRNPDEDLPADFDEKRGAYYALLQLTTDANTLVAQVRREMAKALADVNRTVSQNPHVQIQSRAGGRIALSYPDPQPEPENLLALKADLAAR
jgi:hypothetical protein